jgi:hypothetical protein
MNEHNEAQNKDYFKDNFIIYLTFENHWILTRLFSFNFVRYMGYQSSIRRLNLAAGLRGHSKKLGFLHCIGHMLELIV